MNKLFYILISIISFSCTNQTEEEKNQLELKNLHSHIDYLTEASNVIVLQNVLKQSKQKNKPILFYFTARACVNARKMEKQILNDSEVLTKLHDNFIFIPLSVDDRTPLPKNQWQVSTLRRDTLKQIGNINSELQIEISQTGSQPYFVIIDWHKNKLGETRYESVKEKFLDFLDFEANQ
jgi:thiol:disulfide interchange protein DsbD